MVILLTGSWTARVTAVAGWELWMAQHWQRVARDWEAYYWRDTESPRKQLEEARSGLKTEGRSVPDELSSIYVGQQLRPQFALNAVPQTPYILLHGHTYESEPRQRSLGRLLTYPATDSECDLALSRCTLAKIRLSQVRPHSEFSDSVAELPYPTNPNTNRFYMTYIV